MRIHRVIHEIKTKGYFVIGVSIFLSKLMRFLCKKTEYKIDTLLITSVFSEVFNTPYLLYLCLLESTVNI